MPKNKDEALSRAKKSIAGEESSAAVMDEVSQVESWTTPTRKITGESETTVETWTTPARKMTGEILAAVETWTVPARR